MPLIFARIGRLIPKYFKISRIPEGTLKIYINTQFEMRLMFIWNPSKSMHISNRFPSGETKELYKGLYNKFIATTVTKS